LFPIQQLRFFLNLLSFMWLILDTVLDEKESMRMVIRAIETDSIDRVEDIIGRLIDMFNSDECHELLKDKRQQGLDGLQHLEHAMEVSLYEGMRTMRQLVTEIYIHLWSGDSVVSRFQFSAQSVHYLLTRASDVLKKESLTNREKVQEIWDGITKSLTLEEDRQKAVENMEKFLDSWRQNVPEGLHNRESLEQQIRMNFERGFKQQSSGLDNLISQLREHFKELRSKLEKTQEDINRGEEKAKMVPLVGLRAATFTLKAKGGARFLNRRDPNWYPRIESSLFGYIQGNMTDDELMNLIADEQLEKDLQHIREHLQGWITSCRNVLENTKIPKLSKEAFVLEARRMWAFAKALLLDDTKYIQHHSELLSKLINTALSSGNDVSPFISIARLPDGSQTLKMKLVVRQGADMLAVYDLLCNISQLAGGENPIQTSAVESYCEYVVRFKETDGIKRFLAALAKQIGKLAEVHVRAALLGEYDVSVGSRLTNPAFNRIYGLGLTAPGFKPTGFNPIDYSGERYYCPTGWRRISINVADSAAEFDRKYGGWHVAYHGTSHELASTILTTGFLPTPGAYSDNEEVVYFSPSIEYAAHPRYAKVYELNDRSGVRKYMQVVLQVRVNPMNIWKKVGGTLPGAFDPSHGYYSVNRDSPPADPNFPENRNLEWLVKPIPGTTGIDMFRNMFVIYGIMIRVSSGDLKYHPGNRWWQKSE